MEKLAAQGLLWNLKKQADVKVKSRFTYITHVLNMLLLRHWTMWDTLLLKNRNMLNTFHRIPMPGADQFTYGPMSRQRMSNLRIMRFDKSSIQTSFVNEFST